MSHKRNSLPLPANQHRDCMSAATKCYKYLRRMLKFDQMDFEFAFWQMLYLFISPQKVYRNCQYRKQTKSQFARDDPAFLVLFSAWLCVTSIGFAVALHLGFVQFLNFLLYVIFVDCIGAGIIIATMFWYILNKYFRLNDHDNDVEWGYAFDVHLNAFFPPLIILHFCQLFFYNGLISHEWFASRFLGNTFWLIAICYYIYITFLGYSSLHFLHRTQIILVPIPLALIFYVVSIGGGFNITHYLMTFYRDRVV
ncbi:PREDICTED: protein unc-50 homolog [Nicrophorus vespilloides]|uniref:Protein unc-50 homolog n=1 Tax=Nicrophorus vespilloides TaxID=110193 RepID=A0ABM1MSI3_NICVS|nr:PREDICTED: protein unc-50 homolog [Nicrophorus vespilloides]XP_017777534.1 PREDICTED: protein unc-50 homolog [Nicrophorus vespilloides]